MTSRAIAIFTAALATACGDTPEVGLCLRTAADDPDPLGGSASTLVLQAIPLDGLSKQESFSPDASELRLPELAFGSWTFVVQALDGDEVLATGRSPRVQIDDAHVEVPCVYVATVGTFGDTTTAPPAGAPRIAFTATNSTTALVATDAGLLRYDHITGELSGEVTDAPVDPAGAIWAHMVGGRTAVIARDRNAAIVTAEGDATAPVAIDAAVGSLDGARAIGVGETTVLVVGGAADTASAPQATGSVRVVDLADGSVTPLEDGGGLAVRDARIEDLGNATFLVVGHAGSADVPLPSSEIAIVDPLAGVISRATLELPRRDPMVAVWGANVLVLGGADDLGAPTTAVQHYRVLARQLVRRQDAYPLTIPRTAGTALVTDDGVVVTGGQTEPPEAAGQAERFTFEDPPVAISNPPGVALLSPVTVQAPALHDGAILVVGDGAAVVYRP